MLALTQYNLWVTLSRYENLVEIFYRYCAGDNLCSCCRCRKYAVCTGCRLFIKSGNTVRKVCPLSGSLFGFTLSIFELRENRSLLKVAIITSLIICGAALLLSFIGLISVLIHTPARIPIFVEGISDVQVLGVRESLLQFLPSSSFEALVNGTYILPLCIFGGFAGAGCAVDRNIAKPTITLIDSLARISYAVMVFFVDMLVFGMVAVSSYWVIKFHEMLLTAVFADFAILLIVDLLIIALVIYPALLKIFCRDINPYRVLYASLAPMMAAFFHRIPMLRSVYCCVTPTKASVYAGAFPPLPFLFSLFLEERVRL